MQALSKPFLTSIASRLVSIRVFPALQSSVVSNTVVVVPSPAIASVFVAASLIREAPIRL